MKIKEGMLAKKRNQEKTWKEKRGITLIALVITIIVLLILAGVTIATLTGENGILTKATEAKDETEISTEKEQISVAYSGAVAEKEGDTNVTADDMNTQFGKNNTNADAEDNLNGTIKVTFSDSQREYTIDSDGNIDSSGDIGDNEQEMVWDSIENEDGTLTLTNYRGKDTVVTVPSKLNGKKVTSVGNDESIWDESICEDGEKPGIYTSTQKTITKVIISEGIENIGNYAFVGMEKLTEIVLPDTLKTIGNFSFMSTNNLEEIFIPKSVTSIGMATFNGWNAAQTIKFESDSLPTVGYNWNSNAQVLFGQTR